MPSGTKAPHCWPVVPPSSTYFTTRCGSVRAAGEEAGEEACRTERNESREWAWKLSSRDLIQWSLQ